MEVILAKSAGFCYGVRRAVELTEQAAEEGRQLRERARREAVRLGRLALPELPRELLEKALEPLSPPELERWSQVLQRQAAARLPIPQTAPAAGQGDGAENGSFVV